jgi:hypothetical protein
MKPTIAEIPPSGHFPLPLAGGPVIDLSSYEQIFHKSCALFIAFFAMSGSR